MWQHVSNVLGTFGTLETCRHMLFVPLSRKRLLIHRRRARKT